MIAAQVQIVCVQLQSVPLKAGLLPTYSAVLQLEGGILLKDRYVSY